METLKTLASEPAVGAAIGFVVGMILGVVHFGALWWNTRLYTEGGSTALALALQLGRFVVLAVVLAGIALLGALPLLTAALGLLLARRLVVRRLGKIT